MADTNVLTKKDFKSDQEVRWCPGCGDYAILNCVQGVCADLKLERENTVFVSGIGCSSRFPYYMNTYGFHTIHGRAPAFATGIKTANPELNVWMVTGDGDGLSIGGNHLAHILRRNVDINILLFNNEIYGLTKGQYSPTSPAGKRTKSSPMGSVDRPFNPLQFALGCNATFVARTVDNDMKHMARVLKDAAAHKGTSFVEILQNCVIFNDGCFNDDVDKKVRADRTIDLRAGEPMIYGKDEDKGLKMDGWNVSQVAASEASVWDPTVQSASPAFTMATLDDHDDLPSPFGILRSVEAPCYDAEVKAQIESAVVKKGEGQLKDLIYSGDTWEVK